MVILQTQHFNTIYIFHKAQFGIRPSAFETTFGSQDCSDVHVECQNNELHFRVHCTIKKRYYIHPDNKS